MLLDELHEAGERSPERIQQVGRRRVAGGDLREHLLRCLVRLQLVGYAREFALVAVQVGHTDLEQPVQRYVDHFLGCELCHERLCAEPEVAVRAR